MSILKYLKRVPVPIQDEGLPEPSSSLSNVVPPKAIEMANAEVVKVKNKAPHGARSVPYLILTPAQRYEVSKELQSMALQLPFVMPWHMSNNL